MGKLYENLMISRQIRIVVYALLLLAWQFPHAFRREEEEAEAESVTFNQVIFYVYSPDSQRVTVDLIHVNSARFIGVKWQCADEAF